MSRNNTEIAMKFTTFVKNGDSFYTDLNGFQVVFHISLHTLPLIILVALTQTVPVDSITTTFVVFLLAVNVMFEYTFVYIPF